MVATVPERIARRLCANNLYPPLHKITSGCPRTVRDSAFTSKTFVEVARDARTTASQEMGSGDDRLRHASESRPRSTALDLWVRSPLRHAR
jgi:hypothetical protein